MKQTGLAKNMTHSSSMIEFEKEKVRDKKYWTQNAKGKNQTQTKLESIALVNKSIQDKRYENA